MIFKREECCDSILEIIGYFRSHETKTTHNTTQHQQTNKQLTKNINTMATRGIKQLTKLSLTYCEHGGSSRYMREFISSGRIIDFANKNPTLEIDVKIRNGKHPFVKGYYLTGQDKQIGVKNEGLGRIEKVLTKLNNSSGRKITKLKKPVVTSTPSVQGVWSPMLAIQDKKFDIKIVD